MEQLSVARRRAQTAARSIRDRLERSARDLTFFVAVGNSRNPGAFILAVSSHLWHCDRMRFAIDTPTFGPYSDPRLLADLAREAEDSGWDGFFVWDHIQVGWPDTLGKLMILVTTNEELGKLNPAIIRPRRCLSEIEFRRFGIEEGNRWLRNAGCERKIDSPRALSELYAILGGHGLGSCEA